MARKTEPAYLTEQGVFPTRLRELMNERRVSQKKLSEVIEKRPQTVSLYVTGQSVPDINCLRKMAEFFDVSADWMLGRPGASKTVDANAASAEKYTGLSETAIEFLHSIKSHAGKALLISRMLENGVFQKSALDDLVDLCEVQLDFQFERFGMFGQRVRGESGGYNVSSWDYLNLLEYRISRNFESIIDSITQLPDDDKELTTILNEISADRTSENREA